MVDFWQKAIFGLGVVYIILAISIIDDANLFDDVELDAGACCSICGCRFYCKSFLVDNMENEMFWCCYRGCSGHWSYDICGVVLNGTEDKYFWCLK